MEEFRCFRRMTLERTETQYQIKAVKELELMQEKQNCLRNILLSNKYFISFWKTAG